MKSEILVFLFVLILTVNFSFAATTDSSQASCEDSDHGIDYIVKGSLNYKLNIYSDTCENNYIIKEYYCSKSGPIFQFYKCSGSCQNGACSTQAINIKKSPVNTPPQKQEVTPNNCADSDNGINIYSQGSAELKNNNNQINSKADFCASDQILYEQYCKYSTSTKTWTIEQLNYKCSSGCTNGRCLQPSNIQKAPISESQKSNPQKNNFFTNLFGFFSISGRAVQQTQKNTSVPSALILLAIIVIALIYLRKIYDEPQPRNQSKRLLNNRKK